jgi:hypothetical protein
MKVFMMLACWFCPTSWLNKDRRLSVLDFLDTWGKWSLIDAFVMVQFMVAFYFNLSSDMDQFPLIGGIFDEAGASASIEVVVEAKPAFHAFIIATFGSMAIGHVMTACHRYALQLAEYSPEAICRQIGKPVRLCNVLRPPGRKGWISAFGPIIAMGCSIALVAFGMWIETFCYTFGGLTGYILGPENEKCFSVISLGMAIPGSTLDKNSFEGLWLQCFYYFFSIVMVLAYFGLVIVLWCAPLSPRLQTHFFVAAQVTQAWSGLDVLVAGIFACVMEMQRSSRYMVGTKCDSINEVLKQLPIYSDIPEPKICFDVHAELRAGYWILLAAAIISTIVGQSMIGRCKAALLSDARVQNVPQSCQFELPDSRSDVIQPTA